MKQIYFNRFRNSDYMSLLTQILVILSKISAEILQTIGMDSHQSVLANHKVRLSISMDRTRKNPYTQSVANADQTRDNEIQALKFYLQYCLKRNNPAWHPGATLLIEIIKDLDWQMQRASYSEESKKLHAFFSRVDASAELTEALGQVEANEIYSDLKKYQEAFQTQYNLYIEAEAAKDDIDPKEEKEKTEEAINEFVYDLNYLVKRKPTPEAIQIEEEVSKALELLKTQIKTRNTRAQNGNNNGNDSENKDTNESTDQTEPENEE